MNFEILPTLPTEREGYVGLSYRVLREMLRLPPTVSIVGVRPDPDKPGACFLDLRGSLPADGELIAEYTAIHTTIPQFQRFVKP